MDLDQGINGNWVKHVEGNRNPAYLGEDEQTQNGTLSIGIESDMDQTQVPELETIPKIKPKDEFEEESNYKKEGERQPNKIQIVHERLRKSFNIYYKRYSKSAYIVIIYSLIFAYGIAASIHWNSKTGDNVDWCNGIGLLWLILGAILLDLINTWAKYFHLYDWVTPVFIKPSVSLWEKAWTKRFFQWMVYLAPLAALLIYLVVDTNGNRQRLVSFLGLVVLILFGYIFSYNRSQVKWRPVIWGLTIQYIFGFLTIRWKVGRNVIQCLANKVTTFLAFTNVGTAMVYGDFLINEKVVFAFQALSTIFFFSFCVQILYYYGIMQWIIIKMGKALQKTMGTTACESINTAASIFVGMTESPLLIKPYINDLTKSEIFSVMTSGLATIAGTVMAAYISFGVSPAHLITASVMSAPAALCYAKLFYPETEKTKTGAKDITMGRGEETNVLDAAATGAINAISLILGIIANLIAFVSFVAFLNAIISWLGGLVGVGQLSFELRAQSPDFNKLHIEPLYQMKPTSIKMFLKRWFGALKKHLGGHSFHYDAEVCFWDSSDFYTTSWVLSKLFIPLAWLLGVAPEECEDVATLMGLKTIVNEFVAYEKLGTYVKEGRISKRAEALATYALCGFANPGSVGILIGGLTAMAPEKRPIITELALRAFIAGSATCFLTACVAGTLIDDRALQDMHPATSYNVTN